MFSNLILFLMKWNHWNLQVRANYSKTVNFWKMSGDVFSWFHYFHVHVYQEKRLFYNLLGMFFRVKNTNEFYTDSTMRPCTSCFLNCSSFSLILRVFSSSSSNCFCSWCRSRLGSTPKKTHYIIKEKFTPHKFMSVLTISLHQTPNSTVL